MQARWRGVLTGVALSLLPGCGASSPSTSATSDAADDQTASLHVWLPAFAADRLDVRKSTCNAQLSVELSLTGDRIDGAVLTDQVEGACDALVLENKRFYEMQLISEECGSKTYEGLLATARGTSQLRLIDHSQRTCPPPASYTVELAERHGPGPTRRFAGSWR